MAIEIRQLQGITVYDVRGALSIDGIKKQLRQLAENHKSEGRSMWTFAGVQMPPLTTKGYAAFTESIRRIPRTYAQSRVAFLALDATSRGMLTLYTEMSGKYLEHIEQRVFLSQAEALAWLHEEEVPVRRAA